MPLREDVRGGGVTTAFAQRQPHTTQDDWGGDMHRVLAFRAQFRSSPSPATVLVRRVLAARASFRSSPPLFPFCAREPITLVCPPPPPPRSRSGAPVRPGPCPCPSVGGPLALLSIHAHRGLGSGQGGLPRASQVPERFHSSCRDSVGSETSGRWGEGAVCVGWVVVVWGCDTWEWRVQGKPGTRALPLAL